ncbi:MAG TPA: bifunctional glycosyltransferase family 2 protein/CDP-glycerol:glycerophosphate glycerophosphotransferase, partial [Mobilitalea sp.]|nr:bifunctional glycosyltransferase family 2 protein/CDP-glycerol:glycerophosphate glycerophosphotransferase [Mobilitalea sp.]
MEDCFESIRDQGISGFETILVLDHVKEDVSELLNKYQDINIKTIELNAPIPTDSQNGNSEADDRLTGFSGVAAARNAGLEAATGEYIYFLDGDDYIMSGTLSLLLKEAQEQNADFTYGKKPSTWFRRMVYLSSTEEKEEEAEIEEEPTESPEETDTEVKLTRRQKKILKLQQAIEEASDPGHTLSQQKVEAYYSLLVSRKGLRNVSVLGVLFRTSFLNEHEMRFNEDYVFFSDSPFMVQALEMAKNCSYVEEAVYVKRKHNDPIHYPALSQTKTMDRFDEFIKAYKQCRGITTANSALRRYIDQKLISYFANTYAPRLRRSEKAYWKNERFKAIQSCMKEVDENTIKSLKEYKKKIVKALIKGNVKRATWVVTLHLGHKKFKKIRKNGKIFSYYLYQKVFSKMAIKQNWVVCETFFGKSYSDSPKYIYEYLSKNYPGKYRFILVVNRRTKIPYPHTRVRRFSIRYAYFLARSKYFVFNVRQPEWFRKREGSVFLETWHGTPLKKLVFDQEEVMGASPLYKAQFYKHSRDWDYLVSANHFSTGAFNTAFLFDKDKILEHGYPRNDILHSENRDAIAAQIKKKLNIPEGKKTILYAPTWRDDEYYGRGQYKFALQLDLRQLRKELGDDYVVLLRTHYFIADSLDVTGVEDFAVNVSKYDDISELYLISDILITDYSSVFFDYANLKRPILFYTYDLDKYRDMLRGFYMDIETEVPGP